MLKLIPVMSQFLTTRFEHCSDFCRRTFAFDHRLKVTERVRPAELMTIIVQMAVRRVAIIANDATKIFTQLYSHDTSRLSASNRKQRACATSDRPETGLYVVFTAACFVHIHRRGLPNVSADLFISRLLSFSTISSSVRIESKPTTKCQCRASARNFGEWLRSFHGTRISACDMSGSLVLRHTNKQGYR